jgi:hypothetical protein
LEARAIGSTTFTSNSQCGLLWTPPDEGTYRIVASFDGSSAYYSSWGETSLAVTAAPESTSPEVKTSADNTLTIVGTGMLAKRALLTIEGFSPQTIKTSYLFLL